MKAFIQRYTPQLEVLFVFGLAAAVRLTSLNVFRVVDEEDRWRWAIEFYQALLAGDLSATLVGDGYPGIFPVWLETIWLFLAAGYRSVLQGGWIGEDGIYLLLHEWGRWSNLGLQRFPIVLVNTLFVVGIYLYIRKLFDRRIALLAAILVSLDPFYLSDSRVNRAEALLTGLMTLSMLALVTYFYHKHKRHLVASAIFGGLAWLTKSQALVLLPMFGVIIGLWHWQKEADWVTALKRATITMLSWIGLAATTFILLWPATWTVPGPTFSLMTSYLTRKVGADGVKIFFMGQTVLDEDPGLLFYPVIFLLRVTPLTLIGLIIGLWLVMRYVRNGSPTNWRRWFDKTGVWAILLFALLYVAGMTLGSHKQDRFLMSIFPALGILAAIGWVGLLQRFNWLNNRIWGAGVAFLLIQLITVLPFHPYYFSYFNPLIGGGPTAIRLTRIGWGEGMDQVADYLNTLDNPESLTISTRFYQYLLGFKGKAINLNDRGRWVQADKIIFYVQQAQRMLDPSPGVIRYFQQHVPPEKVITINRINYAWVYPNPVTYPANPTVDQVDEQLALFGYHWQTEPTGATAVLIWENLSNVPKTIGVRLWANDERQSPWQVCQPTIGFEMTAVTVGEVVESTCTFASTEPMAGLYSLQVGLQQTDNTWHRLPFAAGWSAIEAQIDGKLKRVAPEVAFARLADKAIPNSATRLARAFDYTVRLLAYEVSPTTPQPGQPLSLTLYWQMTEPMKDDMDVTVQAFIGEERVALLNGPPVGGKRLTSSWQPGEVIKDVWTVPLAADLVAPALIRMDVGLFRPDILKPLQVRNLEGVDIPGAITYLRLVPESWPTDNGDQPLDITFADAIKLIGQEQTQSEQGERLDVTLYWQALTPLEQDQTAFVHLLKADGTLAAQSDVPPANGHYPVSAWQTGDVVLSQHTIVLPPDLPSGTYRLVAGLYHPSEWTRLSTQNAVGQPIADNAAPIGNIEVP